MMRIHFERARMTNSSGFVPVVRASRNSIAPHPLPVPPVRSALQCKIDRSTLCPPTAASAPFFHFVSRLRGDDDRIGDNVMLFANNVRSTVPERGFLTTPIPCPIPLAP